MAGLAAALAVVAGHRGFRGRRLLGRGLGAGGLAQRGARLSGGGLGALGLARLAGGDSLLRGLLGSGPADRLGLALRDDRRAGKEVVDPDARRDLRRAAAFGWIAPDFAARSSASSPGQALRIAVTGRRRDVEALFTSVFAAARRGPRILWRRSELRTRLRPDGERAPVHLRGVLAKSMEPLDRGGLARARDGAPGATPDGTRSPPAAGMDAAAGRLAVAICQTARSMVAILGGLAAALSWAIATLVSSRSSRMIGPMSVLGWVMAIGLVTAIVPAILATPTDLDLLEIAGLVAVGISHNLGLLLAYAALSIGRVSIVAPIVATEGALAAVISIVLGESSMSTALLLAAIAAASSSPLRNVRPRTPGPRSIRHATVGPSSLRLQPRSPSLSGSCWRDGSARPVLPPAWVMVVSRTIGTLAIALPLLLTRRFRLTRAALPLVAVAGVLEVFGGAVYVVAASERVAVAAVLSSQFAAIAAVAAFFLFRERLSVCRSWGS